MEYNPNYAVYVCVCAIAQVCTLYTHECLRLHICVAVSLFFSFCGIWYMIIIHASVSRVNYIQFSSQTRFLWETWAPLVSVELSQSRCERQIDSNLLETTSTKEQTATSYNNDINDINDKSIQWIIKIVPAQCVCARTFLYVYCAALAAYCERARMCAIAPPLSHIPLTSSLLMFTWKK